MGEGYWEKGNKTVYLCTECLSLEEVPFGLALWTTPFKLVASSKKENGYRIRLSGRELHFKLFRFLVSPHIPLCSIPIPIPG